MKDNGFKLAKERSRRYPAQTIMDVDYADDIALLVNTPTQAEARLHSLERAAAGIGLHINANKTEYMCSSQRSDISTLNVSSLKLVDKFNHQRSSALSTEKDINTQLANALTAMNRLSVIWKSNLTDKMYCIISEQRSYGCTTRTLTKPTEEKLEKILLEILNRSIWIPTTHHENYRS